MRVLIVEDEAILAMSLEALIGIESDCEVVGTADNLQTALSLAAERRPDFALVDIQLARGESGIAVASALNASGVPCMFMTGNVPAVPRPDLTLGCLAKPFTDASLLRTLEIAGGLIQGQSVPAALPSELQLY